MAAGERLMAAVSASFVVPIEVVMLDSNSTRTPLRLSRKFANVGWRFKGPARDYGGHGTGRNARRWLWLSRCGGDVDARTAERGRRPVKHAGALWGRFERNGGVTRRSLVLLERPDASLNACRGVVL